MGVHAVHVCRSTINPCSRSSTPAVDRPVDRLHGTCSRFVPVDRPGRSAVQKSLFKIALRSIGRSTEANGYLPTGPAVVQTGTNDSILDLFCFLWVPTAISCSQVVKLTPNDLVSLMNGIYPLPINRGHGSLVFNKKNIQVSSVFKRRSVSLLFIFKVLSIAKLFS